MSDVSETEYDQGPELLQREESMGYLVFKN
jgi:hypothetical protein